MKYLIQVSETYRVDNEKEVMQMIDEAKQNPKFLLSKHSSQYKERKQKGEVIDSWYKVTLVKNFTDEKEPDFTTTINYEV